MKAIFACTKRMLQSIGIRALVAHGMGDAKLASANFPDMKGCSPRRLKYMCASAEALREPEIAQQLVAQLPWVHNSSRSRLLDNPMNSSGMRGRHARLAGQRHRLPIEHRQISPLARGENP